MTPSSSYSDVPRLELNKLMDKKTHANCPGVCEHCSLPCEARGVFSPRVLSDRAELLETGRKKLKAFEKARLISSGKEKLTAKESPRQEFKKEEYKTETNLADDEGPCGKDLAVSSRSSYNQLSVEEKNNLRAELFDCENVDESNSNDFDEEAKAVKRSKTSIRRFFTIVSLFFKTLSPVTKSTIEIELPEVPMEF